MSNNRLQRSSLHFLKYLIIGALATTALILSIKDGRETGTQTLPQLAASQMMGAQPAVRANVNERGECVSIHLRDGNLRACEDQPDWKSLPSHQERIDDITAEVDDE